MSQLTLKAVGSGDVALVAPTIHWKGNVGSSDTNLWTCHSLNQDVSVQEHSSVQSAADFNMQDANWTHPKLQAMRTTHVPCIPTHPPIASVSSPATIAPTTPPIFSDNIPTPSRTYVSPPPSASPISPSTPSLMQSMHDAASVTPHTSKYTYFTRSARVATSNSSGGYQASTSPSNPKTLLSSAPPKRRNNTSTTVATNRVTRSTARESVPNAFTTPQGTVRTKTQQAPRTTRRTATATASPEKFMPATPPLYSTRAASESAGLTSSTTPSLSAGASTLSAQSTPQSLTASILSGAPSEGQRSSMVMYNVVKVCTGPHLSR